MRIVLSCWGSYGDLFPYLAIAQRLQALGHEPVLATCPFYHGLVLDHGVRFHPVGPDVDPQDSDLLARIMDPARGTEFMLRTILVPGLPQALEQLRPAVRNADLVVTHPVAFAGPIAADAEGVPWISTALAPISLPSVHDLPLYPPHIGIVRVMAARPWTARLFVALARRLSASWVAPVRTLRRRMGLADVGHPLFEGQYSPRGTLALFSTVLASRHPDWPPHVTLTGFPFFDGGGVVPPEVDAFLAAGEPPVVFTLGSSAVCAPGAFFRESVEAAARAGYRALMLVGPGSDLPAVDPSRVCVAAYAPHAAVFARARVIVHHGGVGTLGQALRAGRPMLVVPHAHDQADNASRATRLGVARTLDARRYTADSAAPILERLGSERQFADRATAVAAAVAAERGIETACEAILAAAHAHGGARRQELVDGTPTTGYR